MIADWEVLFVGLVSQWALVPMGVRKIGASRGAFHDNQQQSSFAFPDVFTKLGSAAPKPRPPGGSKK